jgi:murein DD-endopeptidase MepM/ murein hydrolase activator NlpD
LFVLLLLAACSPPGPSPSPAPAAVLNPTEFLATRVPQVLTENAATSGAIPTATVLTPTPSPSATRPATASPTPTPPAAPSSTPTLEASPYPTLALANFPPPPPAFEGGAHFYFQRPVGAGGSPFIASSYRYGSTNNHRLEVHHGVEFPNGGGIPLVAVAPGTVYYAGSDLDRVFGPQTDFYGNLVVLQLAEPWFGHTVYALYGHLDQVLVQTGQPVNTYDLLGTVGATGVALGAHLHFEARLDNPDSYWATRNPELWLAPINSNHGAVAVRVTNAANQYLPGVRVNLYCSDGGRRFLDTYWDWGVTPDDLYGENAAMTDVPAGYCRAETTLDGQPIVQEFDVQPGTVNFVWLSP